MPTYEQWVGEVEKALKGAPFDKRMYTKTYEGVTLRPIYTRQDWPSAGDPSGFPAATPFTRGSRAAGNRVNDWDVRQSYAYPDPSKCNDIILNDLARGVTSIHIVLDAAGKAGLDPPGRRRQAGGSRRRCHRLPRRPRPAADRHLPNSSRSRWGPAQRSPQAPACSMPCGAAAGWGPTPQRAPSMPIRSACWRAAARCRWRRRWRWRRWRTLPPTPPGRGR